uniref:Uncharacterized protein n=1 Tax=Anguilla anguilla TaxID=7936 RepID=A0A0E9SPS9_ANGAN
MNIKYVNEYLMFCKSSFWNLIWCEKKEEYIFSCTKQYSLQL